jgi:hypothetical protein
MSAQHATPAAGGATPEDPPPAVDAPAPERPDAEPAVNAEPAAAAKAEPVANAEPDTTAAEVLADVDAEAEPVRLIRQLNRPARWIVAAVEVLAAVGFVLLAAWAWRRAAVPYELPEFENQAIPRFVHTQSGPWTTLAVGFGMAAVLLVVDAVREAVLAQRARVRRR